jgi:hypothetical protein
LSSLDDINNSYEEVTGRSNTLVDNCETLLEQQHSLQVTVEKLQAVLTPFDDIETIAQSLGIPVDSHGKPVGALSSASSSSSSYSTSSSSQRSVSTNAHVLMQIDPRSQEFKRLLNRLVSTLGFVRRHPDIRDASVYLRWLEQLQQRAASLITAAMRELLSGAQAACSDYSAKQAALKPEHRDEKPLESSPVYQKFRGLSFRMRELAALLQPSNHPDHYSTESKDGSVDGSDVAEEIVSKRALEDMKESYVVLRSELLLPVLSETVAHFLRHNAAKSALGDVPGSSRHSHLADNSTNASGGALSSIIRHTYSVVLRMTRLEQQLFDSLFVPIAAEARREEGLVKSSAADSDKKKNTAAAAAPSSDTEGHHRPKQLDTTGAGEDVLPILASISQATSDLLRPLVIREAAVDELCKAIRTLAEDVRGQILGSVGRLAKPIIRHLVRALDATVGDAQERLTYCVEIELRREVQLFSPSAAHLNYPELLQEDPTPNAVETEHVPADESSSSGSETAAESLDGISRTWYPPLLVVLALLSKLYGVVDMTVFEDFARRAVRGCVTSLQAGSLRVKRIRAEIDGDLFLIRHLLILREQLVPFEIRMQTVERRLDFTNTGSALSSFVRRVGTDSRALTTMTAANPIMQLSREGLPTMVEKEVDARRELDIVLKEACANLRQSAVRMLVGPLESFLAKVSAFAGDIPVDRETAAAAAGAAGVESPGGGDNSASQGEDLVLLPSKAAAAVRGQAFLRPGRIREMLDKVMTEVKSTGPELKKMMRLYIKNTTARTILLRPVLQEIHISRKRADTVLRSLVDDIAERRELEKFLASISLDVASQLSS